MRRARALRRAACREARGIGGAIFIIGFLLSGILADYKEAERIPAEIRTAMEAINGNLFVKMGTAWWLLSR
jgi:hypothetical protein